MEATSGAMILYIFLCVHMNAPLHFGSASFFSLSCVFLPPLKLDSCVTYICPISLIT